ncbi:MAG: leucyl aminopeptidase family protein [SAR324 cluster bacterium]|nr:leucyl aminopeptidase family protein [SAR324 cluster bacterium]
MNVSVKATGKAGFPHRMVPLFSPAGPTEWDFAHAGKAVAAAAATLAKMRNFKGAEGESMLLPHGDSQWLFTGLGEAGVLTRPRFAAAIARGFKELRGAGAGRISLLLPSGLPWPEEEAARLASEALHMTGYAFMDYRTRGNSPGSCTVEVVGKGQLPVLRKGVKDGGAVGGGVALTRDLINHPAGVAHTDFMLAEARKLGRLTGASYRAIRGDRLLKEGYGAIHAVGRAAEHPPALAVLEYGKGGRRRPTVALVGKGVVFDTGGLDLKSSSGMAMMKKDMGGAAIVMGALRAIAGLGLPVHLVTVLGLAENAVGPRAYHPGDILRSKQGLTIEITNTDAEGRVVLADAYALALTYKPRYMIDFATLTGACRIALGKELMGLFCNDNALRDALVAAGEASGDNVWPLPLWEPYRRKLDSSVADLVNAASDGMGGAITAAMFLKEFAGDVAWAHLDCYAWSDGDHPQFPKGGSGAGVRLIVDLITRILRGEADGSS